MTEINDCVQRNKPFNYVVSFFERERRKSGRPMDFDSMVKAVNSFVNTKDNVVSMNKRVNKIINNSDIKVSLLFFYIDEDLFVEADREFFEVLLKSISEIEPLLDSRKYYESLLTICKLIEPVNKFFESVMVMDSDVLIRENRIKMLYIVKFLLSEVCDFSKF